MSSVRDMWFANISTQFIAFLFILLTRSFTDKKFLWSPIYWFFFFFINVFSVISKNCSLCPRSRRLYTRYSSKSFTVLHFIFKPVIHFEFSFVQDVRIRWRLWVVLFLNLQVSSTIFQKDFPSPLNSFCTLVKNQSNMFVCIYFYIFYSITVIYTSVACKYHKVVITVAKSQALILVRMINFSWLFYLFSLLCLFT